MKILQADDHKLFRSGVNLLLRSIDNSIEMLESEDFNSTEQILNQHPECDLVLLDLDMPGMNGINGVRHLVEQFPAIPLIILSASEQRLDIEYAKEVGAAGFVPKSSPPDVLCSAIRLVMAGGMYFPPATSNAITAGRSKYYSSRITPRQTQILEAVADGLSNSAIASLLKLSESTVKGHINSIMRILEVDNRVQAINRAYALGVLREPARDRKSLHASR